MRSCCSKAAVNTRVSRGKNACRLKRASTGGPASRERTNLGVRGQGYVEADSEEDGCRTRQEWCTASAVAELSRIATR